MPKSGTIEKKSGGGRDSAVPPEPTSTLWQVILGPILIACNVAMRLYCAVFMIIADCDETYNYWEPLNLLFRGFGKQTWEYSPVYAIRSYAYLVPYYISTFPPRDFQHLSSTNFPAYYYFYAIRIVGLCGFTAFTEYKLYRSVQDNYSKYAANWYLLFSTFAPGMSHASVALLPSSFAMTWVTWAASSAISAINTQNNEKRVVGHSVHAIACFVIAGFVGWPFALALGVPFGLFTVKSHFQTAPLMKIVLVCSAVVVLVTTYLIKVDSYFYNRKFLFVPVNIVLYNVFAGEGEGPEIFGVEPFSYYVANLLLNFNAVFVLAYLGILGNFFMKNKLTSTVGITLPLLIWSVVFGRQPHKEERFLYPIYPFICLSAAVFTSNVFALVKRKLGYAFFLRLASFFSMFVYVTVSVLRILNLVANYSAPLTTARAFHTDSVQFPSETFKNICVGREWYHFPTSFFLPDNYRLRFVQSGFDGLLPGDFPENMSLKGAASALPSGMNSKNIFSPDKVVPFADCDYYIDNSLPVNESSGEPSVVSRAGGELIVDSAWEILVCEGIINPDGAHSSLGRILYVPEFARGMVPYHIEKMDYCVVKRR
ncbi:hypothetical protein OXX69_003972 [Metschnikowia pulcherrima]